MRKFLCALLSLLMMAGTALATSSFSDSRFYNVRSKPREITSTEPRVVTNLINNARATYNSTNWSTTLVGAGSMTYGGDVDGGQWITATTTNGGTDRAFVVTNSFTGAVGEKWILSFTVDAKSGTLSGNNIGLNVCSASSSTINNPSLGRNALVVTLTAGGSCQFRIGNGTSVANANTSSITISNIQLEKVEGSRGYPYEYVNAGDMRVFPYTYTASLSGGTSGLVQSVVQGSTIATHYSHNVLIVGDSTCNDENLFSIGGDFPYHMRRLQSANRYRTFAVSQRCVAGTALTAITASIDTAFAETTYTTGVRAWQAVLVDGGINDVIAGATLAQLQARIILAIQKIRTYGAVPILVTIGPYNSASGAQNTVITGYNAWLRTLGPAVIDFNYICNDGSNAFAAKCKSGDGLHPGQGFNGGAQLYGKALLDILPLLH